MEKLIQELRNIKVEPDLYVALANEKLPLVMWGSGEVADEICGYCDKYGIDIDSVYVDDEYYVPGMNFHGAEVVRYSDIVGKYDRFNVIIGHSSYENGQQLQSDIHVNKVFYMFSVNYGLYDKSDVRDIEKDIDNYIEIYDVLADEESRTNMIAFLKTRVSGNSQYIVDTFQKEYNFYNNDVFKVGPDEVFMDVGAYNGDTIKLFLKESGGSYKKIYALEPDEKNHEELNKYISAMKLDNVNVTKQGAWNKKDILRFVSHDEQISSIAVDGCDGAHITEIQVDKIDNLFNYPDNEQITMFKINYYEGVKEAFMGAENILKNDCPKISSTVGFYDTAIYQIPLLIKEINPDYKIYLRFNRAMTSALTMYAVVG